jgi:hypothetical protein
MVGGSLFALMISIKSVIPGSSVSPSSSSDVAQMRRVLKELDNLSLGRELLQQASKMWNVSSIDQLSEHLKWGVSSKTDTVLTRYFDLHTGKEEKKRQTTIFLKKGIPDSELMLDLSHELVHAIVRPEFDPYDVQLTPGRYVLTAIEGKGGEIDAVQKECQIELEMSVSKRLSLRRCKNYFLKDNLEVYTSQAAKQVVNRKKIRQDFYKVGHWYSELVLQLGKEVALFAELSSDEPQLYSSNGQSPYPATLLQEYNEITTIACENSKKRMQGINLDLSLNKTSSELLKKTISHFIENRCM